MRKLISAALVITGCLAAADTTPPAPIPAQSDPEQAAVAQPYADLRGGLWEGTRTLAPNQYRAEDLYTYTFNEHTVFQGSEELQHSVMERGKNPGLGLRALHSRGITGKGVSVAVIDQNLLLEPPEFAGRIAAYYECGFDFEEGTGSMHGPAVTSILAGKTTGVAPGAKVYYAAAPSWTGDAAYYANGLNWVIQLNSALPEQEKIRVVSVSAAPSGPGSPFEHNLEQWDEMVARAQAAGILVIDCRDGADTGFISHGYHDPDDPDNLAKVRNGWSASGNTYPTKPGEITVPCDFRTTVEQYEEGEYFFRYGGAGGLSWGVPYAAGVLALGWQVNPALSADEIKALLLASAYNNEHGERIIHPEAFIEAVTATLRRDD